MKKILPILAVVVLLAACKTKVKSELDKNRNMVLVDTTGLHKSNVLTDVGNNKYVITEKPVEPVSKVASRKTSGSSKVNNSNTVHSSGTSTSTNAAYPQRDKGWSDAAKGTAIGGGAGAVVGAVVSKNNRVGGAVIGSVVGAGAGYAIGRSRDKKSGRVARTRAWKNANQ